MDAGTHDIFAPELPTLLQRHLGHLTRGSGLSLEVIQERGYRSIMGKKELADVGFAPSQQCPPGLLLPVCPPDGSNGLHCYRPDVPRTTRDGKTLKYEFPRGATARLDVPPRCHSMLANPAIPLWLTEGQKKAGVIFGDGSDKPLAALGLEVHLDTPPRDEKLWRKASVVAYRQGHRLSPAEVFRRVVAIYDRFIDFARSLADQSTMCELSACQSFVTWLHDAFTVLGYPWPNGESGSGKTHWGTCWARTSYLGEVLLSSGSFAALRDLAEYGATLLFDDAEILADVEARRSEQA